jgi:CRP-like cAMP-binding protein
MFVIERGAVRIESPGPRPRVIGELSRGEFFGEMSLLTGEPRAADVVATEETEVLVLDRAGIAPLIEQNPVLAEKITRVLVERQERLLEAQGSGGRDTQPGAEREELLGKIRRFFGLR